VAAEPESGLITDCEMTMAAGQGSTDAENGVKMAGRDRFHRTGPQAAADPADDDGPQGTSQEQGTAGGQGAAEEQATEASMVVQQTADMLAKTVRDGEPAGDADPAAGGQDTAGGQRLEMYGDSAYGTGQARADYRDGGHDTVIKPGPLRPAVPGGFTIDDFSVDEDRGTVTCPNGVTRQMSKNRAVTFGAACAGCPLRGRCTTAKDGRSMTIHPHEGLLRAARAQARTPEFKRAYPTRASIERTIAWIATCNGRRVRLRYIGTARNDAWLHNRCAGLNLRTLVNAGLTRSGGAWILA